MCNVRDMGKDAQLIFDMRADLADLLWLLIGWCVGLSPEEGGWSPAAFLPFV